MDIERKHGRKPIQDEKVELLLRCDWGHPPPLIDWTPIREHQSPAHHVYPPPTTEENDDED